MNCEILNYRNQWIEAKERALNTIGLKKAMSQPDKGWKVAHLQGEHSPIRTIQITARWTNIPYWVAMHLVRHKIGVEWYVSTSRTDRTNTNERPSQNALVTITGVFNAQSILNISRKRLCRLASPETTKAWQMFIDQLQVHEPEIAACAVKECVYRGFCPEWKSCGYVNTNQYRLERCYYLDLKESAKYE